MLPLVLCVWEGARCLGLEERAPLGEGRGSLRKGVVEKTVLA